MTAMKAFWLRLEARIDALNLRERVLAFLVAALLLVTLVNTLVLDPLFDEQKRMAQGIRQAQQQVSAMQDEIRDRVRTHEADPDAPVRARLDAGKRQSAMLHQQLQGIQQDLVPPEKMVSLLEEILRRNGRLQLMALKTLPVSPLHEAPPPGAQADKADAGKPAGAARTERVYRHGVEIVVQGTYADITHYLAQLEAMPWRLFWENATLNTETYPVLSLKLSLFTLSLDENWLNL